MEPTAELGDPLPAALRALRDAVCAAEFTLAHARQHERRILRDRLGQDLAATATRAEHLNAPLLVIVGGVTGAGKSTFVNTLVGRDLLATGPVRPTTFAPALVCHPDDGEWFASDALLGDLARVEETQGRTVGGQADAGTLRMLRTAAVPPGLALLDAPDIDSISQANRELANQLLDAADLWLWFTTAGKYADEDSMAYLRRARARRTALAVVLTQAHANDLEEIAADFRTKLAAEELIGARLFTIPSTRVTKGRLPPEAVAPLRDWLHALAEPNLRRAHRRQTLEGALAVLPEAVDALTTALADERRLVEELRNDVDRAYARARERFMATLEEGLPLRADVVARWDRFVGAGKLLKATEAAAGQARAWVRGVLSNVGIGEERRLERQVRVEVADTLVSLLAQIADVAAVDTVTAWSSQPAGKALLEDASVDSTRADDFDQRAEEAVREWQAQVTERVETAGASRRTQARVVSSVVSVAATSAILVAMASSGITGAEAGIAAAAGAANQGLLVKLLGEANLRALVSEARTRLLESFDELLAQERGRFASRVEAAAPDRSLSDDIVAARNRLLTARSSRG